MSRGRDSSDDYLLPAGWKGGGENLCPPCSQGSWIHIYLHDLSLPRGTGSVEVKDETIGLIKLGDLGLPLPFIYPVLLRASPCFLYDRHQGTTSTLSPRQLLRIPFGRARAVFSAPPPASYGRTFIVRLPTKLSTSVYRYQGVILLPAICSKRRPYRLQWQRKRIQRCRHPRRSRILT